jgi:3-phenylpropionate/trans-cinnamate dioxygenase ferredoxin reductase subunit
LTGETTPGQLTIRDVSVLERKNIDFRAGVRVSAIDIEARSITLHDGSSLSYSGLMLATGASPRTLPHNGPAGDAIRVLRSRGDADQIAQGLKDCAQRGMPLVVIGGGFIGLEIAASARKLGIAVTVLEAAPRLLERAFTRELSVWYAQLHISHGAELVFDARIASIDAAAGDRTTIRLADGRSFTAGLVVAGIGVRPNDELAQAAGIACDNGILVDDCGCTSVAGIVAAGDCTVRKLPDGSSLRLESVQNAVEQGRAAALALLGTKKPFVATPWFWSDQYDIKLQIAGLSRGADTQVVRGDMTGHSFSIFHFRAGRLVAVDSINAAKDHMLARQLIGSEASPTIEQVSDPAFNLASLRAK